MTLRKDDFAIATLDDELRVDGRCRDLLMAFYRELLGGGMGEEEATQLANSADFYARDYVIGYRQKNLLDESSGIIRQFAGNWYIVNTLEPTAEELARHLRGIRQFYHYLHRRGGVGEAFLAAVDLECTALPYYQQRIQSFWDISGDGYYEWLRECSLQE